MEIPADMKIGFTHSSNGYGDFVIAKYDGWNKILVRFIETGYEKLVRTCHIRNGSIKDPMFPNVYGVGFIGVGIHKSYVNGRDTPAYSRWQSMMQRCYDDGYHKKKPTYKDCEVCEEWQNFQTFADWFYENYPKDGGDWHIDKDIKIKGNKIYSPETCTFVTQGQNTIASHAKNWKFISPDGDVVFIYNLNEFCRENKLIQSHMCAVSKGTRKSHKGWTSTSTEKI